MVTCPVKSQRSAPVSHSTSQDCARGWGGHCDVQHWTRNPFLPQMHEQETQRRDTSVKGCVDADSRREAGAERHKKTEHTWDTAMEQPGRCSEEADDPARSSHYGEANLLCPHGGRGPGNPGDTRSQLQTGWDRGLALPLHFFWELG